MNVGVLYVLNIYSLYLAKLGVSKRQNQYDFVQQYFFVVSVHVTQLEIKSSEFLTIYRREKF